MNGYQGKNVSFNQEWIDERCKYYEAECGRNRQKVKETNDIWKALEEGDGSPEEVEKAYEDRMGALLTYQNVRDLVSEEMTLLNMIEGARKIQEKNNNKWYERSYKPKESETSKAPGDTHDDK